MISNPSYSSDCMQSSTPLVPNKHIIRPRVLTKNENAGEPRCSGDWSQWRELEKPRWDNYESPQYVDFLCIPETRDSFFDQPVIASTPKPNTSQTEAANETQDDTLMNSLGNISISTIIANDDAVNKSYTISSNCKQNSDLSFTVQKKNNEAVPAPLKSDNRHNQMPIRIATKPSTTEARVKPKEAVKEEVKWKGFKAKPVPKFVKEQRLLAAKKTKEQDASSSQKDINANEGKRAPNAFNPFAVPKPSKEHLPSTSNKPHGQQRQTVSENLSKKSIEIWKKKPFIPKPAQKPVNRSSKAPGLYTAARAGERKRFDDILKQKEREMERSKEMEELARKKKEEEEIAELRKMTVHKAQPIRHYKSGLPSIPKRPLTDPIGPTLLKRPRYK